MKVPLNREKEEYFGTFRLPEWGRFKLQYGKVASVSALEL